MKMSSTTSWLRSQSHTAPNDAVTAAGTDSDLVSVTGNPVAGESSAIGEPEGGSALQAEDSASESSSEFDRERLASLAPGTVIAADDDHLLFSDDSPAHPAASEIAITRSTAIDVGLALNMSWGDLGEGVAFLASRLEDSRCGVMIENVSLDFDGTPPPLSGGSGQRNVTSGAADAQGEGNRAGSDSSSGRSPGSQSTARTHRDVLPGTDPTAKQMVSVDEQLGYEERGYQFVLVGTPTELNAVLRQAAAQSSCRVEWASESVARGRVLETMSSPQSPQGEQWIDAILWWDRPDIPKALRLARRASEAAQPEPLLRIPIRIIEEQRLRQP